MFNQCTFVGRLKENPTITNHNDSIIGNFVLVLNDKYKNGVKTSFVNCVSFGKLAQVMHENCKKMDNIILQCTVQNHTRTINDVETTGTNFVVKDFKFCPKN